jgi:hypothetical protein
MKNGNRNWEDMVFGLVSAALKIEKMKFVEKKI